MTERQMETHFRNFANSKMTSSSLLCWECWDLVFVLVIIDPWSPIEASWDLKTTKCLFCRTEHSVLVYYWNQHSASLCTPRCPGGERDDTLLLYPSNLHCHYSTCAIVRCTAGLGLECTSSIWLSKAIQIHYISRKGEYESENITHRHTHWKHKKRMSAS